MIVRETRDEFWRGIQADQVLYASLSDRVARTSGIKVYTIHLTTTTDRCNKL